MKYVEVFLGQVVIEDSSDWTSAAALLIEHAQGTRELIYVHVTTLQQKHLLLHFLIKKKITLLTN